MGKKRNKKDNTITDSIPAPDVYQDDIDYYFFDFCRLHGIDPGKIKVTQFKAALTYIYTHVIKPNKYLYIKDKKTLHGEYNVFKVNMLADRYIYMSRVFGMPVSLQGFGCLSGIDQYVLCKWRFDDKPIYITDVDMSDVYNNIYNSSVVDNTDIHNNLMPGGGEVTLTRKSIYEKIIYTQVDTSDDLMLDRPGVNSIAYNNRVYEQRARRAMESRPAIDAASIAKQLGISDSIMLLDDSSKE